MECWAISSRIRGRLPPGIRSRAPAPLLIYQIWHRRGDAEKVVDRSAYDRMLQNGELDKCGVTLLAGKAVGAPFVGAVAASLVMAEVLRLLHGGPLHELIDLDLKFPECRTAVRARNDFSALNPGYVDAVS